MADENCLSITSSLETPTMGGSGSFDDDASRGELFSTLSPLSVADKSFALDTKGAANTGFVASVPPKQKDTIKAAKPKFDLVKEYMGQTGCIGGGGVSAAHCNDETLSPSFLILDGVESIALGTVGSKAVEGRYGDVVIGEAVDRWAARVDTKICVGNISYEYRQEEERSIAAGISDERAIDESSLSPIGSIVSQSLSMKPFTRAFDGEDSRIINTDRYMRPSHSMVADHLKHREFSEALVILEKISDRDRETYGRYDLICGLNAHNLGVVKLLAGLRDEALIAFHEAVLAKKDCLGERNPHVVDSLVEVGILFYARGEFVRALQIFNEALDILGCDIFTVEDNGISRILNNIGCTLFAMGNTDEAMQSLMKALAIHRMAMGSTPKAESSLMNLALTQANLGHVKLSQNNGEAHTSLEEALLVLQSVLGDENETDIIRNTMDNIRLAKDILGGDAK